jgi:GntR family transcriptional regulator of arabinose operon
LARSESTGEDADQDGEHGIKSGVKAAHPEMPVDQEKVPKYQRIYAELHAAITSGTYREGQRLPSEAALVEQFGASRLTVARALKELQSGGLVIRRAGSGTYVQRAVELKGHVFGLLIPDLGQTEIFEPICQGMMRARQGNRNSLLWGNAMAENDRKEEQAEHLCRHYVAQRVSGVFFAPLELTPTKDEVNRRIVEAFDQAGIPVVLLDRCIYPYPRRSKYDLVGIDNRRAGYTVTEHLLGLGCKRIVFLGKPHSAATVDARIAGYREALYALGISPDGDLVQRIDPADVSLVRSVVDRCRPDGFVCANDHTAALLMRSLTTLELGVPDDVRIVGIDDVKYASLLQVPLTTLHQPCHDIGAAAMSAMLERILEPATPARDILLDCSLIVRQSCGASSQVATAQVRPADLTKASRVRSHR